MTTVVCAYNGCPGQAVALFCERHQAVLDRAVPDRLEKSSPPGGTHEVDFTPEEVNLISIQVDRDALPLYLAAMQHLFTRGIGDALAVIRRDRDEAGGTPGRDMAVRGSTMPRPGPTHGPWL